MTPQEIKDAIAETNDAIEQLEIAKTKEPVKAKRDALADQIRPLRKKVFDLALEGLNASTPALLAAVEELRGITDAASKNLSISQALKDAKAKTDEVVKLTGGKEIQCKTAGCGEKVVYLPAALAAIAAVGGKKKISLICKKLHSNEYEIAAP
jgi:hypothetical protein